MKKIVTFVLGLFLITGCSCGNTKLTMDTPTKKVENFFSNFYIFIRNYGNNINNNNIF